MGFMSFFSQKRRSRYVRQSCFERGFELNSNLNLNHKPLGLGTETMGLKRSVIQIRSRVNLVKTDETHEEIVPRQG
jgi:hypothetical protein